uniref:Uncharacterized protein n=1 Tax=Leersia perrieri TaxID=77586 RepID=A0A0D9WIH3_9ORYZ
MHSAAWTRSREEACAEEDLVLAIGSWCGLVCVWRVM